MPLCPSVCVFVRIYVYLRARVLLCLANFTNFGCILVTRMIRQRARPTSANRRKRYLRAGNYILATNDASITSSRNCRTDAIRKLVCEYATKNATKAMDAVVN